MQESGKGSRLTGQSAQQGRGAIRHRQGILTITHQRIGRLAYCVLLAALAAAAFGGLHDHGVYFHDDETFRDNAKLAEDPTFFLSAEREHRAGRPVASLIKWWALAATGNEPGPAHVVVIVAHTAASLLLAGICLHLGLGTAVSGLAGLLFLLNVVHFQAVFHIAALDFPLALMLSLVSRALWQPGVTGRRRVLANICLVAAMACHLSTAVLVLLRLHQSWQQGALKAGLREHALTLGMVVGTALLLLSLTPAQTTTSESLVLARQDPVAAVTGALRMLAWMAARLVTSAHWLVVDLAQRTTPELVLGTAVLAGLGWLSWRHRGPSQEWAAWTLAFLLPFASISEQLASRGREGPSHYLYLATAGASVLLALGIYRLCIWLESRKPRVGWIVAGVLVISLSASSIWSLWRLQPLSLYNTGRYLFDRDPATAATFLRRAIDGGGGVVVLHEAYLRLALVSPLAGADPYPVLQEAAALYPTSVHVQGGIAIRELESPDPAARARGEQRLAQASQLAAEQGQARPFGMNVAALCHNIGGAYERAGLPERATHVYRRALPFNPDPDGSRRRLANAFRQLAAQRGAAGDSEGALAALDSVRQYDPAAD